MKTSISLHLQPAIKYYTYRRLGRLDKELLKADKNMNCEAGVENK